MREYYEFDKIPDVSKLTRLKQDFYEYIRDIFERLVEITEPICREMYKVFLDMLTFDTTRIESYVAENNPNFAQISGVGLICFYEFLLVTISLIR